VVRSDAPPGEHVSVTLLLQSPQRISMEHSPSPKQYPLAQAASLIVSIVQPMGLHLVHSEVQTDNALYAQSHVVGALGGGSESPFWAQPRGQFGVGVGQRTAFGATENILCEKQSVFVRVAILEELARELHGEAWQCRVESNDTSIVTPQKCVSLGRESMGGAMYATVLLEARQPGFATLTFREQDVSVSVSQSAEPVLKAEEADRDRDSEMYVFDDPQFLRTFATIRVVDSTQCMAHFGVRFADEATGANETVLRTAQTGQQKPNMKQWDGDGNGNATKWAVGDAWMGYWGKLTCVVAGVLFVLYMVCGRGSALPAQGGGRAGDDGVPLAAFNPLQNLNLSQNNPYLDLSGVNHSNLSFNM